MPFAVTANVAACPTVTVWFVGCVLRDATVGSESPAGLPEALLFALPAQPAKKDVATASVTIANRCSAGVSLYTKEV